MTPLYIFDLDGTLADCTHRLRHIAAAPKDWKAFFAESDKDTPIQPLIDTARRLARGGAEIWVWTGRSDEACAHTVRWLERHLIVAYGELRMRMQGDHRPDDELKGEWLRGLGGYDRDRLVAIFEDRDRVVEMYRAHGATCFQVAPGAF